MSDRPFEGSPRHKLQEVWDLYNSDMAGPKYRTALDEYRQLSNRWRAELPDEHCSVTDPIQWDFFSDFYKDRNGFRPKGVWTAAQVDAEIDAMKLRIDEAANDPR